MRLADFVLANMEAILAEWEAFARGIWPRGAKTDPATLRDHAELILRAMAQDMRSAQTPAERSDKSQGHGRGGADSDRLNGVSEAHVTGRAVSGFDLMTVVSEYRALRATIIRLWRDANGDPDHRDLDDLTRFNETIDQSVAKAVRSFTHRVDRARQMFLAILGHDLRNPLTSIVFTAAALARAGGRDAELLDMASQIKTSGAAIARMISDLLDFTAAGLGGAMPLSPAPMDLGPLCQEVVDEMRAAYPGRTIRYEPSGDLTGQWDAARLRQVVSNLLGNALQHGHGHAPVDLWVSGEGPDVRLAFHNEGPPIPPDALSTIFDPLVRSASAPELKKQRQPGSIGLGLHIAREVVTTHGGTIDVESSPQGRTVFTVMLPRTPPALPVHP
jgi:signal transduction histidine kinase